VAVGADVEGDEVGDAVIGVARACSPSMVVRAIPAGPRCRPRGRGSVSASSALQAVELAEVGPADRVLITGAAGGVGHYAVQIAAARGAEVTGVCAPHAADLVRDLGASRIIDYTTQEITDAGASYDVIIDCGGNRPLRLLRRAMARQGRLVVVGGESGGRVLGGFQRLLQALVVSPLVSQTLRPLTAADDAEHLAAVTALVEAGTLRTAIDSSYPMDDVAAGVARLRVGGLHGKVVVTL
jgi:NADPH:quinone reductase-like Zn-dependent oxidoreductase